MFKFFGKPKNKVSQNENQEVWFARKFDTDSFIQIPVSPFLQNILLIKKTNKTEKCFCPVHFKWEAILSIKKDSVLTEKCSLTGIIQRYSVRTYCSYSAYNSFYGSDLYRDIKHNNKTLEELTNSEFLEYLKEYKKALLYEKEKTEYLEKEKNGTLNDSFFSHDIHKDVLFYKISTNRQQFTMTLEQYAINRAMIEKDFPYIDTTITEVPFLISSELYDIKKDKCLCLQNQGKNLRKVSYAICGIFYPEEIYSYCEMQIKQLMEIFMGRKINYSEYKCSQKNNLANYYIEYYEQNSYENNTSFRGEQLKALVYFPYEPALYFSFKIDSNVDMKNLLEAQTYRMDTNCYKNYCNSLGFSSYRTLYKLFLENQDVLLVYCMLKQIGFKDINIINHILSTESIGCLFLHYHNERNRRLDFFLHWTLPLKGEKNAWKLVEKGFSFTDGKISFSLLNDSLNMFQLYFNDLDEETRRSILKDGFTKYNHDLLSNIGKKIKEKNVDFTYTDEEKALEDEIDGYSFRLPKDYYELVNVATMLHNCAASYKYSILEKRCLVMYGMKKNEYKLCIEVRGKVIHQQRADRNKTPIDGDAVVLGKWRNKHGLFFYKNQY